MQRYAWTLILPMFLGCAGKNVVSGEEQTNAEKLATHLPSWCAQTCQRFQGCEEAGIGNDVNDCAEDCAEDLAPFAKSEPCAETGRAYQACLDSLSCSELDSKPACLPDQALLDACLDREEPGEPETPPTGVGGTCSSSNSPSDGDLPTAGSASSSGPNPNGPLVTCTDGDGGGSAGSANMGGGPYVTCQEHHANCSDGHEYSWICIDDATSEAWCTCFVDGGPVGAFTPSTGCPAMAEVNGSCGWTLKGF
jgi:hypothetical protein